MLMAAVGSPQGPISFICAPAVNGPTYRGRLEAAGISVPPDIDGGSFMQVNETWARVSAEEIAARFRRALGEPDDRITREALARAGSVPSR